MTRNKHIGARVDDTKKRLIEMRARQVGHDTTQDYLLSLIDEDLEGVEDKLLDLIEQPN